MGLLKKYNISTLVKALKLMGKRCKFFLLLIFIFNMVEAAGVPLFAYGLKGAVNAVTALDTGMFRDSLLLVALSIMLWIVYSPLSAYLCNRASRKSIFEVKTQLTEHLTRLPQKYHDTRPTGEILSLMSNDADCLQRIYDWDYFKVVNSAIVGISGLITMLVIDWRFAAFVFLLGTAAVFTTSYFSKQLEKTGENLQKQLSKASTNFYELLKAAKTIRLLGVSGERLQGFNESTVQEADTRIRSSRVSAKMTAIVTLIQSLSYILILITGGVFVYYRLSDWGTVISLAGLKGMADCLFSECGMFMAGMQTSLAGVKRLLAVMSETVETVDTGKFSFSSVLQTPDTVLSAQEVTFSYDGETDILKSANITLKTGKLTVLIGESGSGKSTLMKVLMSLYQPRGGKIVYKSTGNTAVTGDALRRKTAYVPQDAMLFHGSIYDNIACGNESAVMEDVIAASRAAGADEFISQMPEGYDTVLIDDGKSLSGGQRQRIAIARALVKGSPILLLDEVTSALDHANEEKVLQTILDLKKEKAVLLITHKPDIARFADYIYRIENGITTSLS